ncbi:MAG: Fic family protein [Verrucomicrobia bacterium]|nr:Fic family protein [Verrucomicrobiota bacterium]MBS0647255.1 Fic family protein [Verrucomicrobiota bacterium]
MSLRDNKMALLRQLSLESEPISLSDLLKKIGLGFKERSVRRWLRDLIQEGSIKKIGQKRSTKYLAINLSLQNQKETSSCFSSASLAAIELIKKPIFEREPIAYSDEWFDHYKPNSYFYLGSTLREQLLKAGQRASNQDPAGTYAHQILNRLLIDLSYNSSRLEGNTYSLLDTERLLLHGNSAEGKLDEEKAMILNHKEAIRYLVDQAPRLEVSYNTICTLHYLLADGLIQPSEAGKIRLYGVRISGSAYLPFEDPKRLKQQLEKIVVKASQIKDPFEQSIFLLIHLSYIQAFVDVNKRTARLAANIPLIKNNLVPLAFHNILTEDYMSAMLAVYELQNVKPIIDLYVYSYMRTCAAYDSTIKSMNLDLIRMRYRQERRHIVREIILQNLEQKEIASYTRNVAMKLVPKEALSDFVEDVLEDIALIDESRLAGLGLDIEEFRSWAQRNPRQQ